MGASKSAGGGYRSQPVNFQQPGMFSPNPGGGINFNRTGMFPPDFGSGMGGKYGGHQPPYRRPGPVRPGGPGGFGGVQGFTGYTPPSPPSSQPAPSPYQQPARDSFADLYGRPRSTPTGGYDPMRDMYGSYNQVQQPMPGYFQQYGFPGGYDQPVNNQRPTPAPPTSLETVQTGSPDPGSGGSPSGPTNPGNDYQAGLVYDDSTGPTGYYPGPTPGEYTPPPTPTIPDDASPYGQDVLERASEAGVPPEVIVAQDQQQQDPTANIEVNVGTFDLTAPRPGEESGFSPGGGSAPGGYYPSTRTANTQQPPTQQPPTQQPPTQQPAAQQPPAQQTGGVYAPPAGKPPPDYGMPRQGRGYASGGFLRGRGRGFAPIFDYQPQRYFNPSRMTRRY